jgi:hypothetical protein
MLAEMIVLAKAKYWPLPDRALGWIAEPPRTRRRRRRHWIVRVQAVIRRLLLRELPDSVRLLTWGRNGQQSQNGR